MTAKLVSLILFTGATACGLLVIRQGRIDAAYEMSQIHERMLEHEQSLWRMRVRVHEMVRSDHIHGLVEQYQRELGVEMTPLRVPQHPAPPPEPTAIEIEMAPNRGRVNAMPDPALHPAILAIIEGRP